jgi:hypothetical protein
MLDHIVTDYQRISKDQPIYHQPLLRVILPVIISLNLILIFKLSLLTIISLTGLLWGINWFIADYYLNKLRFLPDDYVGTSKSNAFSDKMLLKSPFNPFITKSIICLLFVLVTMLIK